MQNDESQLGAPEARYPGRFEKHDSLQQALEARYSELRRTGAPAALHLAAISIKGDNPIREYKVDFD